MLWIAVGVVALVGLVILVHQTANKQPSTAAEKMLAAVSEPSSTPKETVQPTPPPTPPTSAQPVATQSAAPVAEAPSAPAASASAPAPSASAAPSEAAPGTITVIVEAKPPDAVFYHHGKRVSGSPMTVELAPGEKKSFELGKPGYGTRKVIVDGSQPKMLVGLRPESGAAGN